MSNDRVAFYMRSQLLGSGFAIVDGQIAFALSAGVWPSITAAQLDFSKPQAVIDRFSAGCFIFNVVIEERVVSVITRSMASLAARIEQVTGFKVTKPKALDVELEKEISISAAVEHLVETKLDRATAKKLRAAEDSERRAKALLEADRHRAWLAERERLAAESRSKFYAAKRGRDE